MHLKKFRVMNYRSVNDSGPIDIQQRTALVGRNESGKTNLLLALQSLKLPNGGENHMVPLSYVKDFPRDRPAAEFSEELQVLHTEWELTDAERQELAEVFPRAKGVKEVTVGRKYKAQRVVGFVNLPSLGLDRKELESSVETIQRSVSAGFRGKRTRSRRGSSPPSTL